MATSRPGRPARDRRPLGGRARGAALALATLALALAADAAPEDAPAGGLLVEGLSPADQDALAAVAEIQPPLRDDVLEVARHPEILVLLPGWRMEFDARLPGVVAGLDDAARARIEALAAHPYLVDALVEKSGRAREDAIAAYPDDVAAAAREAAKQDPAALRELQKIQSDVAARTEAALAPLPGPARDAFHRVLDEPGLVSLLVDHIQGTVRLGASYAMDPAATTSQLAALARDAQAAREREAAQRAAQEEQARERARREAERRELRRWRLSWGYGLYRYPYDLYWGPAYDPWYWGWYPYGFRYYGVRIHHHHHGRHHH